jgi:hypothetical protein
VDQGHQRADHGLPVVIAMGVSAVIAWLIGRACRYVLAGTPPSNFKPQVAGAFLFTFYAALWRASAVVDASEI